MSLKEAVDLISKNYVSDISLGYPIQGTKVCFDYLEDYAGLEFKTYLVSRFNKVI